MSSTKAFDTISDALRSTGRNFKQTRRSFVIDCPACGKEEKCYVLKEKGHGICFVCGAKWGIRGILASILGITIQEAEQRLKGFSGDDKFSEANMAKLTLMIKGGEGVTEITDSDFDFEDKDEPYKSFYFDPSFIDVRNSDRAREYLIKRGCTNEEVWVRHNLKYQAGLDALVAPVTMFGTDVGYQARFIAPKNPKFRMKTSDGLPRERALLNYDTASKMKWTIVVEGIFDCLKTDLQHHGIGSVATMGKVMSKGQIELIKAMPSERLYLALDRDAYDLIPGLYAEFKDSKEVFRLLPPDNRKDFGDCDEEDVVRALEAAQPRTNADGSERLEVFMK